MGDNRLLEVAAELTDDEIRIPRAASFSTLLESFAHIAAAEVNWLERWTTGANRISTLELQKMPGMDAVRSSFATTHAGLREFIDALTDDRLDAPLAFRDSRLQATLSRPLWQQMMHVANHGTYHRGESAMMLTDMGRSPGDIDFIFWEYAKHP